MAHRIAVPIINRSGTRQKKLTSRLDQVTAEAFRKSRPAGGRFIPSPKPLHYVDAFRFSKQSTDFLARCLRAAAWGSLLIALLVVVIAYFHPGARDLRDLLFGPLITFFLLLPVPLYALRHREDLLLDEEIELKAERAERRATYRSYSRPTRAYVLLFRIAAIVGCVLFSLTFGMGTVSRLPAVAVAVGFATLLPVLIAFYFSRRLVKEKADELDYVRGTSVGREVLVYWIVAALLPVQQQFLPGFATIPPAFNLTLTTSLTVVAMSRMLGSGYKEYREALAKSLDKQGPPRPASRQSDSKGLAKGTFRM